MAHSPDRLAIIPRPADRKAAVAACKTTNNTPDAEAVDRIVPENLGFADFGGGLGYNPWDPKQNLLGRFNRSGVKPPAGGEPSPPPAATTQPSDSKKKKKKP